MKYVDFMNLGVSKNSSASNKKSSNKQTANIKSVEVLVAKGYSFFCQSYFASTQLMLVGLLVCIVLQVW